MESIGNKLRQKIMFNRRLGNWAQRLISEDFWWRIGLKKAFNTYKKAITSVPAYIDFLKKNKFRGIEKKEDFTKLPILEKENYLDIYPLEKLCLKGTLRDKYLIASSAGSTGIPRLWPHVLSQDQMIPKATEMIMLDYYKIDKRSTLVLLSLSLGSWGAGVLALNGLFAIANENKYPSFSFVTPGSNIDDSIEFIKRLKDNYSQIIIISYPPLAKNIIDQGGEEGIDWKKLDVKLLLSGERFSEDWRKIIADKLGGKKDLLRIVGAYASADVGMIGYETPLTITILKLASQNPKLAKSIFGQEETPSLIQFNPIGTYIEILNNQIILTADQGIPLIRYNIKDRGGIIKFKKILDIVSDFGYNLEEILKNYGFSLKNVWRLPLLYIFGRTDAVSLDGANVYIDNIQTIINQIRMEEINSFKISKQVEKNQDINFYILFELKKDRKFTDKEILQLSLKYQPIILEKLLKLNPDYRKSYQDNPESLTPKLKFYPYQTGPFSEDKFKVKEKYIYTGEI